MNCAERDHAFGPADQETGAIFASQAAIVLANAQAYWDAHSLGERLGEAMKSRAVIEQAKGMLMAAQHCDEDRAFELLVRASSARTSSCARSPAASSRPRRSARRRRRGDELRPGSATQALVVAD
jgi:ANTAR domain